MSAPELIVAAEHKLADATPSEIMMNAPLLEQIDSLAARMASAKNTVPKHLAGNEGDCWAVIMQAVQWRMNPFVVAQKTHVVNGALGYEAQLVNAVVKASGAIESAFKYEYKGEGENMECRVGAVLRGESEITWGEWLAMRTVTTRNSPLWKNNPKQQMGYLQCKNWARLHCPEAILGIYSDDELRDSPSFDRERDITPGATETEAPRAAELAPYPADDFATNLPKWRQYIEAGKQSPEGIIAKVSTKGTLTEEQQQQIRDLAPLEVDTETGEVMQ